MDDLQLTDLPSCSIPGGLENVEHTLFTTPQGVDVFINITAPKCSKPQNNSACLCGWSGTIIEKNGKTYIACYDGGSPEFSEINTFNPTPTVVINKLSRQR